MGASRNLMHPLLPCKRHNVIQQPETDQLPPSKRQKTKTICSYQPPAIFWDNLEEVPLTKLALREQNRRCLENEHRSSKDFSLQRQFKTIQRFARGGGPDLTDIRGFQSDIREPESTMSSSRSKSSSRRNARGRGTATTKSTTPYDPAFDQHLTQHRIYPVDYEDDTGMSFEEPENMQELRDRLRSRRRSLSPSVFTAERFKEFKKYNRAARKEKQVSELVMLFIEGKLEKPNCRSGGVSFTNLDPLTDGTIVPGCPDIYYGSRLEQLPKQAQIDLQRLIVPTTQPDLPAMPNFLVAVKGPGGSLEVGIRQARYDGALAARGMHKSVAYAQMDNLAYGNTYTITCVYSPFLLKIYTSHQFQNDGETAYAMTLINTWALDGDRTAFINGATAYRNLRDWAEEKRNLVIQAIKQHHDSSALGPTSSIADQASALPTSNSGDAATSDASETEEHSPITSRDSSRKHLNTPPSRQSSKSKRRITNSREISEDPSAT